MFRRVAGVLGTVALVALGPVAPTAHAETTWCSNDQVTVIVEGQGRGCASAGVTGWQALEEAGFTLTPVTRFPGMICQINGAPDTDCTNAPPVEAYWTYWHAPLGGDWTYSQRGAQNRTAPAGTVEAWTFGPGLRPGPVPTRRAEPASNGASTGGNSRSNGQSNSETDLGFPPVPGEDRPADRNGTDITSRGDSADSHSNHDSHDPAHRDDAGKPHEGTPASSSPSASSSATSSASSSTAASATDTSTSGQAGAPAQSGGGSASPTAHEQSASASKKKNWVGWVALILAVAGLATAGTIIAKRRADQEI